MSNKNNNPTIHIYDYNETYVQIDSERSVLSEISDYFTYDVPNARFMPSYQNKLWDGKYRLVNLQYQRVYKGLLPYIQRFCDDREYNLDVDFKAIQLASDFNIHTFLESLNLNITPYDYQIKAIEHCIEKNRATLLSPTSSGKSLIIYCLIRYFLKYSAQQKKKLIVVPTVGLVHQMMQDFQDYSSFPIGNMIHPIFAGKDKFCDNKDIFITTWQSVYKFPRTYFDQFDSIFIDEAHLATAEGLKGILEKAVSTKFRFGFTGTLNGLEYNRLVIEGLCGPVYETTTTAELIKRNITSNLKVKCVVLKYPEDTCKQNKTMKYQDEMKFVVKHTNRNKIVCNLATKTKGNTLILTQYREHITSLEQNLLEKGKIVYVVTGSTDSLERERIRKLAEQVDDIIIIATYGVFSTGINIKNLQNIIMATGSKSQIRVLQSIGRGLRKDGKGNKLSVYDIIDNFQFNKKKNYILKHFLERVKMYIQQKFEYDIYNINI